MIQQLKEKKYLILLFLLLAVVLIFKRDGINRNLSVIVSKGGGTTYSNMEPGANAVGELLAGDVLQQQMYLEPGVHRVGVRVGTYIRNNDAYYMFSLTDGDGNVLAKDEISASRLLDNQFCYLTIYARTSTAQTYYLTVQSRDASSGNAIACYGVEIAEGHTGAIWNGVETGMELVTEIIYHRVFPFAQVLLACVAVACFIFVFAGQIWRMLALVAGKILGVLRKNSKRILSGCMLVGGVWIVLLLLFPEKGYEILRESVREEGRIFAQYYTEKLEQTFTSTENFDALEIKLGTYESSYQGGRLCFALYEEDTDRLLAESTIPAEEIQDNHFLTLDTGKMAGRLRYRLEIWMEEFGGQPIALYCTEDGNSLVFHLLQEKKMYSVVGIFALTLFSGAAGVVYFCLFGKVKKRWKTAVVTTLVGIVLGLLLDTYAHYQQISFAAVTKNLGLSGGEEVFAIRKEQIEDSTERVVRYRGEETIYSINDQIYINNLYHEIDTVTLYFEQEGNLPVNLTVFAFADKGGGYTGRAESEYQYTYKGQESICIPLGNTQKINNLMLSVSYYAKYSGEIDTPEFSWYALDKIVLNGSTIRFHIWDWFFWAGFLFAWLVCFWQSFQVEQYFAKGGGKNREVKIFVVTAFLFGLAVSLLLPAYQAADEPFHVSHTLASIGVDTAEINSQIQEAVKGVTYSTGVRVDWNNYWKHLGHRLASYPTKFSLHLESLKYPGAALGSFLGLLLRLPVGGILFLGEFFALLVYIVVGAMAIHITPVKKNLFLLFLLLPLPIHQASSFSYDSFNNALSILTLAYLLHLIFVEKKISIKHLMKLAGMLLLLLYIKKVYVLLGILLVLIPWQKITVLDGLMKWLDCRRKRLFLACSVVLVLLFGMVVAGKVLLPLVGAGQVMDIVLPIVARPKELAVLLGRTLQGHVSYWWMGFCAGFGWLDVPYESWVSVFVFVELLIAGLSMERGNLILRVWKSWHYMICVLTFGLITLMLMFSMFSWTQALWSVSGGVQNQILLFESIEGVQGRYFVPILLLLFLFPVSKRVERIMEKFPTHLCLFGGWLVMVVYTIFILLERYWI